MLKAEADWIGRALAQVDPRQVSPLLNVGSATAVFREQVQPWIDDGIFAPLRKRGVAVDHLDMQEGDGIDLRGDLTDEAFVEGLRNRGYRGVLCCNLLEHVVAPEAVASKLLRLASAGAYLIVTVPNAFPYHPDPIDTMFRPDVEELARLFPGCRLVQGEVLDCGTGWDYVGRDPLVLVKALKRRISGMRKHGGVRGSASFMPWLFRRFRETCAVLQAESSES